jgi:hypothetical protein
LDLTWAWLAIDTHDAPDAIVSDAAEALDLVGSSPSDAAGRG